MKKELIPYNTIDFHSKTMLDYISGKKELRSFYQTEPTLDGILSSINDRSYSSDQRELLCRVIDEQYQNFELTSSESESLEKLKLENTFTVTTGHQLCMMGGPLYFFLKIISTINLAGFLNRESKLNEIIPVFWMASEDHDFDEINHIHLFGKKIEWKGEKGNAVGRMKLENQEGFRAELFEVLGDSHRANEVKEIFNSCYGSSSDLAEATRKFVRYFFKDSGLLILDGDHLELKKSFFEPLREELATQQVKKVVSGTIEELAGEYKIQANPSDINLFYLHQNERIKIKRENGQIQIGNDKLELDKFLKTAENHPDRFSPNVLMRPLYQEFVLPNLAYVGGGGELAYWLELKDLFTENKVQFPALVLRNSILWIDERSSKTMEDLGIEVKELFQREEDLVAGFASKLLDENVNISVELDRLKALFDLLEYKASSIDTSLLHTARAQHAAAEKSIRKLEQKMIKSIKIKNEHSIKKVRKLKNKLFPQGKLQERHDSFIPSYLEYGPDFLNVLSENLDPLDFKLTVFRQ